MAGLLPETFQKAAQAAVSKAKQIKSSLEGKKERRKPYIADGDEQYCLAQVEDAKRTRLATLESFEPIWTKSILFLAGIQHLKYISTRKQYEPKRIEEWIPLPVFNYVQPKVERAIDFFTRNRPTARVLPNTPREHDRLAAKVGEDILRHLWDHNDEDTNFDEAASWLITTGNCFKKTIFDTRTRNSFKMPEYQLGEEPLLDDVTGQPTINPETGQPVMVPRWMLQRDANGGPVYSERPVGEVNSYVIGPQSMTVPLATTKLENSPWLMESSMQPLEDLRQWFPDKADFIPERGQIVTSDLYQHRLASLLTSGLHGVARSLDPYVLEGYGIVNYYERAPNEDFKNGWAVIELDGIPLWIGELPAGTEYSYEHCGYHRVPGRFWYRGMVEDLIHPQEQVNKLEQFCQLNDAFMVNPQWTVPYEANVPEGSLKNRPGMVVRYAYPFEPHKQAGQAMPPQVIQRRAMYVQDIEEISGIRAILAGGAPPGVQAGVALNRLGEEAQGAFAPVEKRWARFIERDQSKKLKFVQKFYTIPRYIAVTGESQIQEMVDFQGTDLRSNSKVSILAGSYKPKSLAGQQQLAIDMLTLGMLPGVQSDPEQARKFLEIMGIDGFDPPESLDTRRAKWENETLMRDEGWQAVHRASGDDDAVHVMSHTNFRKTDEFRRLPIAVQQRFLMHEVEHLMAIMQNEGFQNTGLINPSPEELDGTGDSDPADPAGGQQAQGGTPGDGARREQADTGGQAREASQQ